MLSIIIPTYNSENTIRKCVNSILKLKNISYEIILVDDGSTDNTLKINQLYADNYDNILSFHQKNQGASTARNLGIKEAHGKWIIFVDSDDYINANALSLLLKSYLSSNTEDLIVSNILFNGKVIGINNRYIKYGITSFIQKNYPLYGNELIHVLWNKIYNHQIIKKYNIHFIPTMRNGEDLVFNLNYFMHIKKAVVQTDIVYYVYNIHNYSITRSFNPSELNDQKYILYYVQQLCLTYNINCTKLINNLKVKAFHSVMLNGLKRKFGIIKYLKTEKRKTKHLFLNNIDKKDLSIKNKILWLIFIQPSIYNLYLFLCLKTKLKYLVHLVKSYM